MGRGQLRRPKQGVEGEGGTAEQTGFLVDYACVGVVHLFPPMAEENTVREPQYNFNDLATGPVTQYLVS